MNELLNQVVAEKYKIIRLLGVGGMGEVYEAWHQDLERFVAIKVLRSGSVTSGEAVARFKREARASAAIGHPNIIQVFDLGRLPDGDPFIVMEMLSGESLAQRLERVGRLSAQDTADIMMQVLSALAATHAQQIVHRDLKPDNVFLTDQPVGPPKVTLLDFGISKIPEASDDLKLTATGSILGTPFYMSPEQATGEKGLDHRVDIYAVGVMMYECLTGEVPFTGDNYNRLVFLIATQDPRPPSQLRPDIPMVMETIILRAMAKEPDDRFPSVEGIAQELAPFCTTVTQSGPFPRMAAPAPGLSQTGPTAIPALGIPASTVTETPMAWTTPSREGGASRRGLYLALGGGAAALVVAALILLIALLPGGGEKKGQNEKHAAVKNDAGARDVPRPMGPEPRLPARTPPSMLPRKRPEPRRAAMKPPKAIRVRIKVVPKNAWVSLDGKLLPENPFSTEVLPSSRLRLIVAKAKGYEPLERKLRFDKPVDLDLKMKPLPVMRPLRRRYYRPMRRRGRRPGLETVVP